MQLDKRILKVIDLKRLLLVVLCVCLLAGCSTPIETITHNPLTTASAISGSGVPYTEVLGNFRSAAKTAGFNESRYSTGELEETEEQYIHIDYFNAAIKDAYESLEEHGVYWIPQSYDVSIRYDKNNELTSLSITTAIESSYTDFDFAVLSFYLYNAAGLPDVEANAFYEEYNLFFKEDTDIYKQINGWAVHSKKFENFLLFSIWYTE